MLYIFEFIIRWLLLPLSILLQAVVYPIYGILCSIFYIRKYYIGAPLELHPSGDLVSLINKWKQDPIRDQWYSNEINDQTCLLDCYLWAFDHDKAKHGMEALVKSNGSLMRSAPVDTQDTISGDCLSAWCFAYVTSSIDRPDLVNKVAFHYLRNCLGLVGQQGYVGAKCSNNGINYVRDGWNRINQPTFSPQYFTSAAIFALAAHESPWYLRIFWEAVYFLHFWAFGGWIYSLLPFWYPEGNSIYYAQQITCLNAYVVAKTRPFSNLYNFTIKQLMKLSTPNCNVLFYALYLDTGGKLIESEWQQARDTLLTFKGANDFTFQRPPVPGLFAQYSGETFFSPLSFVARLLFVNHPNNK